MDELQESFSRLLENPEELKRMTDMASQLLGGGEEGSLAARAGLKTVRPLIWLGAPAAVALSLFLAPDARRLERWSQALIPACNLLFCFVLLPAVYGLARWKEKKKENQ